MASSGSGGSGVLVPPPRRTHTIVVGEEPMHVDVR